MVYTEDMRNPFKAKTPKTEDPAKVMADLEAMAQAITQDMVDMMAQADAWKINALQDM